MTARAHFVKKARKADKAAGIKKGDSYWWYKFARGPKIKTKKRPRPSQLTRSEFLSGMLGEQERFEDELELFRKGELDCDGLADALVEIAEAVREHGSSCEEKRNNMPDALQDSETGELLQERADSCESIADSLEGAADTVREKSSTEPDEGEEAEGSDAIASEIESEVSWDFE